MALSKIMGAAIKRKEDPRLITGTGQYTDDVKVPGEHAMAIVRSPFAHARVTGIDSSAAEALPGVVAVFTGADVASLGHLTATPSAIPSFRPLLATDEVCHVGDPVAVVVAIDRYAAKDGAEAVQVDYDPLPSVTDMETAATDGSPVFRTGFESNVVSTTAPNAEITAVIDAADVKITQRLVNQRLIPNPIETRTVIAAFNRGDSSLRLWTSTQIPHVLRTLVANQFGLSEGKVNVISIDVGGGFGMKLNYYVEEALAIFASRELGVPVKWVEERRENFTASIHGRAQVCNMTVAGTRDGTIEAIRMEIVADLGAYLQLLTVAIPTLTGLVAGGVYKVPNLDFVLTCVYTNTTPTDAYRGAGRPEATYYLERGMDLFAKACGLDPAEVRSKNWLAKPDEFPATAATGLVYDSADYETTMRMALATIAYADVRAEQKRRREAGDRVQIGIGLSTYTEICGLAPSAGLGFDAVGVQAGMWESAGVRVHPTGAVTVYSGTQPQGQGHHTSWAQIVAQELGCSFDQVTVHTGDTTDSPYGIGTFGSRSAPVGGTAVLKAAQKVRQKAALMAAHLLEAAPDDIRFDGGKAAVAGSPDTTVDWETVAGACYRFNNVPADFEPGLEATAAFDPPNFTFPFGAHVATVEVDTETGDVRLTRFVGVDDCGNVINPMIVAGQIHGGIAQGVAQALFEEARYDEDGNLVTGSFLDYPMPTSNDLPSFELSRTVSPTPNNPLGVKGIGEAGTIGSTPAVVNAVIDALSHLGIDHIDMPLRPKNVWDAIHANGSAK